MTTPHTQRFKLRPWMVTLILCLLYLGAVFVINGSDPLVFVTLGTQFTEGDPAGSEGYDGQFVYFIAADPFTAPDLIDAPAYRYQRILLPALARLLSLGQAGPVPWVLLLINLAALTGGTAILERLLQAQGVSPWYALTYGLFGGVFMAVRLSVTESLAYGLVLAAIWLERNKHPWWMAATLALAALAKETTLLFAGGYGLWLLVEGRWRDAVRLGLVTGGVFVIWQAVLVSQFGQVGIGSGGAKATSFEIIPYNGFWRIYTDTGSLRIFLVFAGLLIPSTIIPSLWALWRSGRDALKRSAHPYVYLMLVNAAIIPFVPFSTFREPLGMLRFIVGLVITVVLYGAFKKDRRTLRYSTLWVVSLLLVLTSG
jgi:hypothetical protein